MATHARPVAKWLAEVVPLSAPLKNAGKLSDLAKIDRVESQPRRTYTPKKQAVCSKFGRQMMARQHDRHERKSESIA
jgi:hypothetical protein